MPLVEILKELAAQGEYLASNGGNIVDGYNGNLQPDYVSWRLQAIDVISQLGEQARPLLREIEGDDRGAYFYGSSAQLVLGVVKAAIAIAERRSPASDRSAVPPPNNPASPEESTAVFIVHGHDEALLQQVARFIEKLELEPIVLFEEPGRGQTIIEKLESNSDVHAAVVLLTPDDVGHSAKDDDPKPRARQNVVLELGYFIGKLGRANVVALYDQSVELPSDYRGVEYVQIDVGGAWKLALAKELRAAGLGVDMNKAL
jgi:predicted nucleotide-binding protein